jgi:hypothetical protein
VKSLRLDPELTERLERAAAATGETLSQFIRTAAAARADAVLNADGGDDWSDILGAVHGGGGRARRSGAAFGDLIAESKSGKPSKRSA